MSHSQYQLAFQLIELIDNKELKKECLLQRAKQVRSANARHYLIATSKEYLKADPIGPALMHIKLFFF